MIINLVHNIYKYLITSMYHKLPLLLSLTIHILILLLTTIPWNYSKLESVTYSTNIKTTLVKEHNLQKNIKQHKINKIEKKQNNYHHKNIIEPYSYNVNNSITNILHRSIDQKKPYQIKRYNLLDSLSESNIRNHTGMGNTSLYSNENTDSYRMEQLITLIREHVEQNWHIPAKLNLINITEVVLQLSLLPDGKIEKTILLQSSNNTILDNSVLFAINNINSLPLPDNINLFEKYFRTLILRFKPKIIK